MSGLDLVAASSAIATIMVKVETMNVAVSDGAVWSPFFNTNLPHIFHSANRSIVYPAKPSSAIG